MDCNEGKTSSDASQICVNSVCQVKCSLSVDSKEIIFSEITDPSIDVKVTCKDSTGQAVANQQVNAEVRISECIGLTSSSEKTNDDGQAIFRVSPNSMDNCRTMIVFSVPEEDIALKVVVGDENNIIDVPGDINEYHVNLQVNINDENFYHKRLNDIQVLGYFLSTEDASMVFSEDKPPKTFNMTQMFMSVTNDNLAKMYPKLYEFNDVEIELANGIHSIVVIAKNRVESPRGGFDTPVVAYAAVPVSVSDVNKTIVADLSILPYDITGKYHVISNFDFSSAFTPTPASELGGNKYPAVENMITGDWVKFVTDLFEDAPNTLIEFAWINIIERVKDIEGVDEWIKNIFANTLVKGVATDLLRPIILCYADPEQLPATTNEEIEQKEKCIAKNNGHWSQKFTTLAPDVSDLITNTQFSGTIDILEIDPERPTFYKNAKETFDTLLFNWSLGTVLGSNITCVNERDYYYVKTDANSCRVPMDLSGMIVVKDPETGEVVMDPVTNKPVTESAISASETWNGTIDENVSFADGQLNIPSHGLKLYWGSILYNAIFGTILPNAFGYGNYNSIAQQKNYLIGLMENFLFWPFVNDYVAKSEEDPANYPSLYITDTTKTCQRFIEALIQSKVSNAFGYNTTISLEADLICNEVIGRLDEKVVDKLNSFVIVTDNGMGLKSDACTIYAEGTGKYQKLGKPDDEFYTANEIANGSMTNRCTWDLGFKMGDTEVDVKGYFHGAREDE